MANHLRQQIRDAATTLLTGLTTTSTRVYKSRVDPLYDSVLPALLVDTLGPDEIEPISMTGAGRLMAWRIALQVKAVVKAVSGYQDTLDTIAKEVQAAIAGDNTLSGKCKWINPRSHETELTGEGEKPIAVCTMQFEVYAVSALNAPDVLS